MKNDWLKHRVIILLGFLLFWQLGAFGQTPVSGIIKDSITKLPVVAATVQFKGGHGVISDSLGRFQIQNNLNRPLLEVSAIGFESRTISLSEWKEGNGIITLLPATKNRLDAVVIQSRNKIKYTNKDNPAVELIRRVIDNKEKNRADKFNYVEYEKYEKVQLSLSRVSEKLSNSKLLKRYNFLFDATDTTRVPGKALTPVYLEERLSNIFYQKSPAKTKVDVEAEKRVNFGEFIDSNGVSSFLSRLYEDIDVYDESISLLTNQFLSPLAVMAPSFYKFYIIDTITTSAGERLIKMNFTPRNTNDFLFRGTMFITLDDRYAVQKLDMTVSPNINLNWVRELKISQAFEKRGSEGRYYLSKSYIQTEAGLSKGKSNGIFAERTVSYKNYKVNQPKESSFYTAKSDEDRSLLREDSYWENRRHDTLSRNETLVYKNIDSLRNMPSFKRFLNLATLVLAGYKSFGPVEIGPASTFYSFNPVEGFRLRFGGRTTPDLSKRLYFEAYGAYGFRDEKWKGFFSFTYSINNKSVYGFPLHYLRVSAQRETKIPGQELQFVQEDNFLLSFKRGENDKWLYNDILRIDYVKEYNNKFSYTVGFKHLRQTPAGSLKLLQPYETSFIEVPQLRTSEISLQLRLAPNEQFYQGKIYRIPIINRFPIFTLRYTKGIKGLLDGQYDFDKLNLMVEKRVYLSQFGYSDVVLEGGYTFGALPYPLLSIHRANQTYAYQLNSYNLMNFLEFVSDQFISMHIDHHFNGFIFNRIPFINKLNLREIVSFKALFGGVRSENDPADHSKQVLFPQSPSGNSTTFSLNNKPYLEGSIGIGNIFRLLRLDLVKRFTYLENPGVAEWGVRGRLRFDF